MPVTLIRSSWSSGSLVFYESTSIAPSTTYNVFTLGTGAVKVGDTANDVDFQYYGTGSVSAIIDCGAATFTLTGIDVITDGDCKAATYHVGATAGADFSGAVTNITVVKGIVTAAS